MGAEPFEVAAVLGLDRRAEPVLIDDGDADRVEHQRQILDEDIDG